MRTFDVTALILIGGFISWIVLSHILAIIGILLFDQAVVIPDIPIISALVCAIIAHRGNSAQVKITLLRQTMTGTTRKKGNHDKSSDLERFLSGVADGIDILLNGNSGRIGFVRERPWIFPCQRYGLL